MINQDTVQKILDASDIVDVVSDFVSLKRRGVNYIGLCPFHNEKTPSFNVSPSRGIYKCFGCAKGGNAVNFIMEHEHLSYPESLKYLAKKYNIEVQEKELSPEEQQQKTERESLLAVNNFAQKFFTETLLTNPEGISVGLSYFKERGFRTDILKKFQVGYCINKKDHFTEHARRAGYPLEHLVKTGLTIQKDNWIIDRFEGRVIFPIHGLSGNVIAFGARTLRNDKTVAKYLNSPESEIYHKSDILYGISFARNAIAKTDKCFMVEGYADLLSMHQAGIENVVASSGTSLTNNQIRLVRRFTKNLTIIYDGDAAGIKASTRGIDMVLEEGMNVKVVLLPDGHDPDSYSRLMSATEFQEYIAKNETDFISFKTKILLEESKNDPIKRASLVNDVIKSISLIPDSLIRTEYIKDTSRILSVKEETLYAEIGKIFNAKKGKDTNKQTTPPDSFFIGEPPPSLAVPGYVEGKFDEKNEKELIWFLLNFGNNTLYESELAEDGTSSEKVTVSKFILNEILNEDLEFKNLVYRQVFEIIQKMINTGESIDERTFLHHEDKNIRQLCVDQLSPKHELSKLWKKNGKIVETPELSLKKNIPKILVTYKLNVVLSALEEVRAMLAVPVENQETLMQIMQQISTLNEIRKILATQCERPLV